SNHPVTIANLNPSRARCESAQNNKNKSQVPNRGHLTGFYCNAAWDWLYCTGAQLFRAQWHTSRKIMENLLRQIEKRLSRMRSLLIPPAPARCTNGAGVISLCASLHQVVFTDEVSRTLFSWYRAHRLSERKQVETGWVLLGQRYDDEAVVLAALPAGQK